MEDLIWSLLFFITILDGGWQTDRVGMGFPNIVCSFSRPSKHFQLH